MPSFPTIFFNDFVYIIFARRCDLPTLRGSCKSSHKSAKSIREDWSCHTRQRTTEMGRRILNDALRTIVNAEKRGFASAEINPISNVMASFLRIMKFRGYIKDFQVHDPQRVGRITVELLGRVKDCRALTYRQDIKSKDIENYKTRALPTRQWGYVVITTANGVLDHEEAIRQNVGGQVLGYFY
ncbi:small ribosomal subunit protein uS8my-like isoform X1 [Primulina eburnea]|uniref:small ribosomal subunit protein uS8my-like isoform X1 n=1 Tax=Primulina eburnea TaxID=1245227 RepID=UPI003C6C7F87